MLPETWASVDWKDVRSDWVMDYIWVIFLLDSMTYWIKVITQYIFRVRRKNFKNCKHKEILDSWQMDLIWLTIYTMYKCINVLKTTVLGPICVIFCMSLCIIYVLILACMVPIQKDYEFATRLDYTTRLWHL